jgi:hypothetical protein
VDISKHLIKTNMARNFDADMRRARDALRPFVERRVRGAPDPVLSTEDADRTITTLTRLNAERVRLQGRVNDLAAETAALRDERDAAEQRADGEAQSGDMRGETIVALEQRLAQSQRQIVDLARRLAESEEHLADARANAAFLTNEMIERGRDRARVTGDAERLGLQLAAERALSAQMASRLQEAEADAGTKGADLEKAREDLDTARKDLAAARAEIHVLTQKGEQAEEAAAAAATRVRGMRQVHFFAGAPSTRKGVVFSGSALMTKFATEGGIVNAVVMCGGSERELVGHLTVHEFAKTEDLSNPERVVTTDFEGHAHRMEQEANRLAEYFGESDVSLFAGPLTPDAFLKFGLFRVQGDPKKNIAVPGHRDQAGNAFIFVKGPGEQWARGDLTGRVANDAVTFGDLIRILRGRALAVQRLWYPLKFYFDFVGELGWTGRSTEEMMRNREAGRALEAREVPYDQWEEEDVRTQAKYLQLSIPSLLMLDRVPVRGVAQPYPVMYGRMGAGVAESYRTRRTFALNQVFFEMFNNGDSRGAALFQQATTHPDRLRSIITIAAWAKALGIYGWTVVRNYGPGIPAGGFARVRECLAPPPPPPDPAPAPGAAPVPPPPPPPASTLGVEMGIRGGGVVDLDAPVFHETEGRQAQEEAEDLGDPFAFPPRPLTPLGPDNPFHGGFQ